MDANRRLLLTPRSLFSVFSVLVLIVGTPSISRSEAPAPLPGELTMTIALEDDARDPITVVLKDSYRRQVTSWEKLAPGKVRLTLPALEVGPYSIAVSANGYGTGNTSMRVSKDGVNPSAHQIALYRQRYAVLRYTANMQGERELTGPDVKEGHVAITFGSIADLNGDWMIDQGAGGNGSGSPILSFRRFGRNGVAVQTKGTSYDDIKQAPPNDNYKPEDVVLEKGMVLLNRIVGNGPGERRYVKILVEDITEKPPRGIEVIEKFQLSRQVPEKRAKIDDPKGKQSAGPITVTVHIEDGAKRPVKFELREGKYQGKTLKVWDEKEPGEIKLDLPALDIDRYFLIARSEGYAEQRRVLLVAKTGTALRESKFRLFRLRYLVVQYYMNTRGERNLTGDNVVENRVAILSGSIPELHDWRVNQNGGKFKAVDLREAENAGFAQAPKGTKFAKIVTAPPPEQYRSDVFDFEKGMIVFSHVVGIQPEHARYVKLLVEDITEKPPQGLPIINSWPK